MGTLKNVRKFQIPYGQTAPFHVHELPGNKVLHVEHIGGHNATFKAEMMKEAGDDNTGMKALIKEAQDGKKSSDDIRAANIETVAKHGVRSFEGFFYDKEGTDEEDPDSPVPQTPEGIVQVVASLPDDAFDRLVVFAFSAAAHRPKFLPAKEVAKK